MLLLRNGFCLQLCVSRITDCGWRVWWRDCVGIRIAWKGLYKADRSVAGRIGWVFIFFDNRYDFGFFQDVEK